MKPWTVLIVWCICLAAAAQQALVTEFPPDATPLADEALRERLKDKVFRVKRPDGNGWRLEYRSSGYFFINTDQGFADKGTWKVEGGRLCTVAERTGAGCSEVRVNAEAVFVKRVSNGEVVGLVGG